MDNFTHTLTGVLLSRVGLNRISPHATLLMVIAANAPDFDAAAIVAGPAAYLHFHRGPLHSFVAMPVLALLVVALVRLFVRKRFSWPRAFLVSLIGVASNPLFDYANTYGLRLLWPFSTQWMHGDFIPLLDPWILVLLVAAIFVPWLLGLVSSDIGAKKGTGRGLAVFVLCLIVVYGFGRYLLHDRAVAVLESRVYQGQAPLRVGAFPVFGNPFRWTGVVEGRDFFELLPGLNLLGEFDPSAGAVYYKPEPRPEIDKARNTEAFRVFLEFSQWTLWRVAPAPDPENAVQVEALDLRFGTPEQPHFAASSVFDGSGRLVNSALHF
jgi:inner membrane protein